MPTAVLKSDNSLHGPLTGSGEVSHSIYQLAGTMRNRDRRVTDAMRSINEETAERPWDPANNLADYILTCYRSAKQHRDNTCVSHDISESYRLRDGKYTAEELQLMNGKGGDVWFPLTDRMCRTMTAFLRNIMARDDDNPNWEITATPVPEVPEFLLDQAASFIFQNVQEQIALGLAVDEAALIAEVERIGDNLLEEVRDAADEGARRMTEEIEDCLEDADWRSVFDDFIDDLVTFPYALIKGPYITSTRKGEYHGDKLKIVDRKMPGVRNVHPENFWFSSDSKGTQDGSFVIERSEMSRRQLEEAKHIPGFIAENIDVVLAEFACSERDWLKWCDQGMRRQRGGEVSHFWTHNDSIDVLEYHGSLPGKLLKQLGADHFAGREIGETIYYECEVFVIDDVIVRAIENIDPEHKRPYHKASLFPKPGSFAGKGIPLAIKDIQRVINAAWRSMVSNMAFSSAPITEMDWALWAKDISKPPSSIHPGMMLDKNSLEAPHNGKLLDVHNIPSRGAEFLGIIAQLIEHAELTAGLPRFLQGDPSGAGGAARTLGGLATLQGNASIGLKSAVVDIDMDIIEPFVEMLYKWKLCTTDDDRLKVDAQVTVRGATHLLAREANKDRILQYIGALFPFVQAGFIEPEGISVLLREVIREIGLDPDRVVIDLDKAQREQAILQLAAQNVGGISGGVASAAQGPTAGPGGLQGGGATPSAGLDAPSQNLPQAA